MAVLGNAVMGSTYLQEINPSLIDLQNCWMTLNTSLQTNKLDVCILSL